MTATYSDLRGQSVFITGGGSGIGAAVTEAFLAQGARVAFVDLADSAEFAQNLTSKYDNTPLFVQTDVTDTQALRAAINKAAAQHGTIKVLVNVAANDQRHTTAEVTPEFYDWMIAINLKSYFFSCQAVVEGMIAAGGGTIINFSSISYMMGHADYSIYTASNAGITSMSRSMARELGKHRIRVNAIAPGWVLTERQMEKWATPESLDAHLARACLKDHLVAEDIVGGVLFLASDSSKMMTGQNLVIDGGVVVTG